LHHASLWYEEISENIFLPDNVILETYTVQEDPLKNSGFNLKDKNIKCCFPVQNNQQMLKGVVNFSILIKLP
jgi:hypothetical protein